MSRLAALDEEASEFEDWMRHKEASVLAYSGHLRQARVKSQRANRSRAGRGMAVAIPRVPSEMRASDSGDDKDDRNGADELINPPERNDKAPYVGLCGPKIWRRSCESASNSKGFCRKKALGSNMPWSAVMTPG
jgi:hypothetical protein